MLGGRATSLLFRKEKMLLIGVKKRKRLASFTMEFNHTEKYKG